MYYRAAGILWWARRGRDRGKRVLVGAVRRILGHDHVDGATVISGPGEVAIEGALAICGSTSPRVVAMLAEDIDAFPFPDSAPRLDALPGEHGRSSSGSRHSRCPFACRFCCKRALTNGGHELRRPEGATSEIAATQK